MQDVLALDASARMNTPSSVEGNWAWRLADGMLTDDAAHKLAMLTDVCDRAVIEEEAAVAPEP
jgi:4-alpha-glucanotransferase